MEYLIACSGGNDSLALIQYASETFKKWSVVYNDTGWAKEGWAERIEKVKVRSMALGCQEFYITESEGMEAMVRRKKGWPMPASNMQFCTHILKEAPTLKLLAEIDPDGDLVIVTGRRRDESQNRANLALWQYGSEKHGGRDVYNPLAMLDVAGRDVLLGRFKFDVLPHQSAECWPCVCANKSDLKMLADDPKRIDMIEVIEVSMGHTRNDKPRVMFRPYRVGNGVGIRQAVEWGCGGRGWKAENVPDEYKQDTEEVKRQCDGGYCGN